jgi:monoterpene epsilon-lactone hydrolase
MADPEIDVVRKILASHPRPTNLAERRKRLDALGAQYSLPEDVRVEGVDAHGVAAEVTVQIVKT